MIFSKFCIPIGYFIVSRDLHLHYRYKVTFAPFCMKKHNNGGAMFISLKFFHFLQY